MLRRKPIAGLPLVLAAALAACEDRADAVLPSHLAELDPEVAALVREHAGAVSRDPRNAELHATLGQVYEAHGLWRAARAQYATAGRLDANEPMWTYHQGLSAQLEGDNEGALAIFLDGASRHPGFAPLSQRLGDALMEHDRLDEAEAAYRRAARAAPERPEPLCGLAEVLLRRQRAGEASGLLEQALALESDYKLAHFLLGRVHLAAGRREAAEAAMLRGADAIKRAIPDRWMQTTARFQTGLGARFRRATQLLEAGRAPEAAALLEPELERHPDNAPLRVNLAMAYLGMGRVPDAERRLDEALALDERSPTAHLAHAQLLLATNRAEQAIEATQRASALDPEDPGAPTLRGQALIALERWGEAEAAFGAALQLAPDLAAALEGAGEAAYRVARYDVAERMFARLCARLPERWQAHARLAVIRMELGDLAGAEAALHRARALAPDEDVVKVLGRQLEQRRSGRQG